MSRILIASLSVLGLGIAAIAQPSTQEPAAEVQVSTATPDLSRLQACDNDPLIVYIPPSHQFNGGSKLAATCRLWRTPVLNRKGKVEITEIEAFEAEAQGYRFASEEEMLAALHPNGAKV